MDTIEGNVTNLLQMWVRFKSDYIHSNSKQATQWQKNVLYKTKEQYIL